MDEITVNGHKWRKVYNPQSKLQQWISYYYCSDGDGIVLYFEENEGMRLECFSGIGISYIWIELMEFNVFNYPPNKVEGLDFEESEICQCLRIADYLCQKFCEFCEPNQ